MAEVKLVFKTEAELAGALKVKSALEHQIGAAKAAGKEVSHLEAQLNRLNKAIAETGATADDAGKRGLASFGLSAETLSRYLHGIPGASFAIAALRGHFVLLIAAVATAAQKLIGFFKDLDQETKEAIGPQILAERVGRFATIERETALETEAFTRKLQEQSDAVESAKDEFNKLTDAIQRKSQAELEIANAEKALDVARAKKELDPVKRAVLLRDIEEKYTRRQEDARLNELRAQQDAARQSALIAKEQADKLRQSLPGLRMAAEGAAKKASEDRKLMRGPAERRLRESEEWIESIYHTLGEIESAPEKTLLGFEGTATFFDKKKFALVSGTKSELREYFQAQLEEAKGEQEQWSNYLANIDSRRQQSEAEKKLADERVKAAEAKVIEAERTRNEMEKRIRELEDRIAQQSETTGRVRGLRSQAAKAIEEAEAAERAEAERKRREAEAERIKAQLDNLERRRQDAIDQGPAAVEQIEAEIRELLSRSPNVSLMMNGLGQTIIGFAERVSAENQRMATEIEAIQRRIDQLPS